jgi:predicted metal-dependent phosphoesterase TrpH
VVANNDSSGGAGDRELGGGAGADVGAGELGAGADAEPFRLELHAHSAASFDSNLAIATLLALAADAGVTHLAITDHDTLDGALEAQRLVAAETVAGGSRAPGGGRAPGASRLTIVIGQEVRTREGDLIGLFLQHRVPGGLSPEETSAAIREQGGVVGLPHGFDPYRPSVAVDCVRSEQRERLATLVDYVEVHNGRVQDQHANARAAEFAHASGLPGVAASDSHTAPEVGQATTSVLGRPDTAAELLVALRAGARLTVRRTGDDVDPTPGPLEAGRMRLERFVRRLRP